jgi:hypothetical protein
MTLYKFRSWTNSPHIIIAVIFNIVHPKEGLRRRPKHVGLVNKQRI